MSNIDSYDDHQDWKRQDDLYDRYEELRKQHPNCSDPAHPGCESCEEPVGTLVRYN